MSSSAVAATGFFPNPLRALVIIAAGSCRTGISVSPHDVAPKNHRHKKAKAKADDNDGVDDGASPLEAGNNDAEHCCCCWWAPEWSNHYPLPLADGAVEAILRSYVESMIDRYAPLEFASATGRNSGAAAAAAGVGIVVVSSAANHRFYESWCARWKEAHCISTGHCSQDEPAARSVQRALRVVAASSVSASTLECVSFIDADALVQDCILPGEDTVQKIMFGKRAILPNLIVRSQKEERGADEQTAAGKSCFESSRTEVRAANETTLVGVTFWGAEVCGSLAKAVAAGSGSAVEWAKTVDVTGTAENALEVNIVILSNLAHRNVLHRSSIMQPMFYKAASSDGAASSSMLLPLRVLGRSHARVGLMGNPSDQLHGKSIAVAVSNWWATVTIEQTSDIDPKTHLPLAPPTCPAGSIDIAAHPVADATAVSSFDALHRQIVSNGYVGGVRLVQATLKKFFELVIAQTSSVSPQVAAVARSTLQQMRSGSIRIQYDTNVPRQVGLAGSSCIVSAVLKALLQFYGLVESNRENGEKGELLLPEMKRPTFVLEVEAQELGINAGLMDRVAQMFEGCMTMDFTDNARTLREGHAVYRRIPVSKLPSLHLAIALDPSDSGKIHATVRARFAQGDPEVLDAVKQWVSLVDKAEAALSNGDHDAFRNLMDANFDLRRKLYGDECLGWKNLRMVEIARKHGAAAKFPGSGGAVLVAARPGKTDVAALTAAMETEGFSLVALRFCE